MSRFPRPHLPTLIAVGLGLAGLAALATSRSRADDSRPETVVAMRMHIESRERYKALFAEWKRYAEAHPRDATAWAQVARAGYYAGESCAHVHGWAQRAVAADPRNPHALVELGRLSWDTYCEGQRVDPGESVRLLERALAIDPTLDDAHYYLWVMKYSQGRRPDADWELVTLLDNGRMPEPLVDFAYNLLVGLDPNAILITNGDNDSYPVWALQSGRRIRRDVTVVNIGMLNLAWYRRDVSRGPGAIPVPVEGKPGVAFGEREALEGLFRGLAAAKSRRPLYLAVTVQRDRLPPIPQLSLEGIVYRVLERPGADVMNEKALAINLDGRYRRESSVSPAVNWRQWSALAPLGQNYAAADWQLATLLAKRGDRAHARVAVERALRYFEFHHLDECGRGLLSAWSQWDARAPGLAEWRKRFPGS